MAHGEEVYKSKHVTVTKAVGGRMDGMHIAKASIEGKTYTSFWDISIISVLRQVVFKKRRGFDDERERRIYQPRNQ